MRRVVYRDDVSYAAPVRRVVYRDDFDYTAPARHEVVRSDYIDNTEEVVYSGSVYDDDAYVDVDHDYVPTSHVTHVAPTAQYSRVAYVADSPASNLCTPVEPIEPCSGAIARTVSYAPAAYADVDYDDPAFFDTDDVTYVAADDIEDACLSPVSYYEPEPVVKTRSVSYVPRRNVSRVVAVDHVQPAVSYIAVDDADCLQPVSVQMCDDADLETVSYVPADGVDYVDAADTAYCPTSVSSFDDSEVFVDSDHHSMTVDVDHADALNNGFAYNEGFDVDEDAVEEMDVDAVSDEPYMDDHVSEFYDVDDSV
jgi:hypothetical protein